MGMHFGRFFRVIKRLNPNIRIQYAKSTRCSMISEYAPRDLDCSEWGLAEICAFPSPRYFISFPKYDFIDHTGKKNRGYTTVFKILVNQKIIDSKRLRRLVPGALSPVRCGPEVIKNESQEPNPNFSSLRPGDINENTLVV